MTKNHGAMIQYMSILFVLKRSFWPHTNGIDGNKRIMGEEHTGLCVLLAQVVKKARVQYFCLITKLAVCYIPIPLEGKLPLLHRAILIKSPSSSVVGHRFGTRFRTSVAGFL